MIVRKAIPGGTRKDRARRPPKTGHGSFDSHAGAGNQKGRENRRQNIHCQKQTKTAKARTTQFCILGRAARPAKRPIHQKTRGRADNLECFHGISALPPGNSAAGVPPAVGHFPGKIGIKCQTRNDSTCQPEKIQTRRTQPQHHNHRRNQHQPGHVKLERHQQQNHDPKNPPGTVTDAQPATGREQERSRKRHDIRIIKKNGIVNHPGKCRGEQGRPQRGGKSDGARRQQKGQIDEGRVQQNDHPDHAFN